VRIVPIVRWGLVRTQRHRPRLERVVLFVASKVARLVWSALAVTAMVCAGPTSLAQLPAPQSPAPEPLVLEPLTLEPVAAEPLAPDPAPLPDSLAVELASLQAQIDSLRGPSPSAAGPDSRLPRAIGADGVPGTHERPSLVLSGQMQGDMVYFSQDPESMAALGDLQDGAQFRRLRLVARGKTWLQLEYAFGVDFALANRPAFLDNYLEAHDVPWLHNVRLGHYFEPFSLERLTQNRNNTFMERSLVDTFAPARNMGVMAFGWDDSQRSTWQIGTFRTNSDNVGNDSFESGQALTMRGTVLPFWDDDGSRYLHLGAAYSFRGTDENRVRFRNTPEIRKSQPDDQPTANPGTPPFAPIFVDTGFIPARSFQLFDPEFALVLGPLSLQSEYAFAFVDQIGGPPLFFNGYMAQLSWFLTGEHRPYDREKGIHTWMDVNEDFFLVRRGRGQGVATGLGAWELAARYSNIVLNDKNIDGNNLTDFTFGLNWYLNKYTRTKLNYVRAFLQDRQLGNSITDAFGMRFDVEF